MFVMELHKLNHSEAMHWWHAVIKVTTDITMLPCAFYFTPLGVRSIVYCDQRVCMSVCSLTYLKNKLLKIFCTSCLRPYLGLSLTALEHVKYLRFCRFDYPTKFRWNRCSSFDNTNVTDRQTTDGRATANSEREREFTSLKTTRYLCVPSSSVILLTDEGINAWHVVPGLIFS